MVAFCMMLAVKEATIVDIGLRDHWTQGRDDSDAQVSGALSTEPGHHLGVVLQCSSASMFILDSGGEVEAKLSR